mgnify:CR=1 FL=1
MNTRIGISNRHVHLTREDVNILFGNNYELTKRNDLDQPGQYAANETVTLKTAKNIKEGVRVVGPIRSYTQVEVLNSDKEYFGINPPVRNSDDLDNSEEITIIGPKGQITRKNICIIANRHIHINTRDKGKLKEDDIVTVEVNSTILDNVHIKIDDSFKTELHINKDDAIKHNITNESVAILKED